MVAIAILFFNELKLSFFFFAHLWGYGKLFARYR